MSKETVKIAHAGLVIAAAGIIEGKTFSVTVGKGEVIHLLALNWYVNGVLAAGNNTWDIGLWKKPDSQPSSIFTDHTDLVYGLTTGKKFVAESVPISEKGDFYFPQPFVLIRPPRMIARTSVTTSATIKMTIYYKIVKVSEAEMIKLMMKDHA